MIVVAGDDNVQIDSPRDEPPPTDRAPATNTVKPDSEAKMASEHQGAIEMQNVDTAAKNGPTLFDVPEAHPGMSEDVRKQLEQDSQPFWLIDLYIERPCVAIVFGMVVLLVMGVISNSLGYFDMDPQT